MKKIFFMVLLILISFLTKLNADGNTNQIDIYVNFDSSDQYKEKIQDKIEEINQLLKEYPDNYQYLFQSPSGEITKLVKNSLKNN